MIIAAASLLFIQCSKQGTFEVTVDGTAVNIDTETPAVLNYTVKDNAGAVSVSIVPAIEGVTLENNLSGTKGTVTFKTTVNDDLDEAVKLVFNDTKVSVEKDLTIHITSNWDVEPGQPEEGEE